ncbi:hypothetical protein LX36DRAFT_650725 [Colletotrichum falcatum]|nr:hypothetical protein LX36DRAFT_650725 [Colletotrichum falcatum]
MAVFCKQPYNSPWPIPSISSGGSPIAKRPIRCIRPERCAVDFSDTWNDGRWGGGHVSALAVAVNAVAQAASGGKGVPREQQEYGMAHACWSSARFLISGGSPGVPTYEYYGVWNGKGGLLLFRAMIVYGTFVPTKRGKAIEHIVVEERLGCREMRDLWPTQVLSRAPGDLGVLGCG